MDSRELEKQRQKRASGGKSSQPSSLYTQTFDAVRSTWRLPLALLVGSVMHAAGHAFLAAAAGLLARVLAGHRPMDFGSTAISTYGVLLLAICGVFAALAKLVGGALASWGEARIATEVGARARVRVLDGVLSESGGTSRAARHLDHDGTAGHVAGHGDRVAALTTHIHDIEHGVAHGVLAEARAIVQLAPLCVLLVVLAPRLAGSAVIALAAFAIFAFVLRRAFRRAHQRASLNSGALIEAADEAVKHAELWATYGARRRIRSHVTSIGHAIAREAARIRVRAALISSTSEVLGALALVLVLALALNGLLGVDYGMVVPFSIAFFMAYRPLRDLVDGRLARTKGEEALRATMEVVGSAAGDAAGPAPAKSWPLATLTLEGVRTGFGVNAPVSISIAPGSIVAIVGATGSGKTSLLRSLLGLVRLEAGSVRYGDALLDETAGVGPGERPFAWVPQDAPIVGDTLAINVALGKADDDAAVADPRPFLRELGAEFLVDRLGDDVLHAGAGARSVSGGERQWIAVARALATGLPVLLLDEPTSALDHDAQSKLLLALKRLRGKRTVILVTHRKEPLAIADVILQLSADSEEGGVRTSRTGPAETSISSAS